MNNELKIVTDVDDTIMAAADVLQQFIEDEFGLFSSERLKNHHNIPKLFNLSFEKTLEVVTAFHRSHWMDKIPPLPCAAIVLPELYQAGYRFVAITACLNEPAVVEGRRKNLQDAFGFEWESVDCIGLNPSKEEALKRYTPSIWVDDLAHHASVGAELGYKSFLINKQYNQGDTHSNVIRVNDWHDIKRIIETVNE